MLTVSEESIMKMDASYPGIAEQVYRFEAMEFPPCEKCGSYDTASIQVGLVGRTMYLAMATTKFKFLPNYNEHGIYFCNSCKVQFGPKKRQKS